MINILSGAAALGLLWAMVTIGVYISYRLLDIADLTVEGSITLGASATAALIAGGANPLLATLGGMLAGGLAGLLTGMLHTRLGIPALLSGILSMIALYSVNIRVMGGTANVSLLRAKSVFTPLLEHGFGKNPAAISVGTAVVVVVSAVICWFFSTAVGNAVRATGSNADMARAQGIHTGNMKLLGLVISNALIGLAGGLIAQYQGFSDVQMGAGAIVIGLASLFIGEVLFGKGKLWRVMLSLVLGSVLYRVIIALVLELGMPATDLKFFTAATVALALCLPKLKQGMKNRRQRRKGGDIYVGNHTHSQDVQPRNGA